MFDDPLSSKKAIYGRRNLSIQQPSLVRLDLSSQAFKQHPFPTVAGMRELGPVARTRRPIFGEMWLATTYVAVNDLLRDHHRFVQNPATAAKRRMGGILRWLPRNACSRGAAGQVGTARGVKSTGREHSCLKNLVRVA